MARMLEILANLLGPDAAWACTAFFLVQGGGPAVSVEVFGEFWMR